MKKVYAIADTVPGSKRGYITPGKEYEIDGDEHGGKWVDDHGRKQYLCWEKSAHLYDGDWRRVERDDESDTPRTDARLRESRMGGWLLDPDFARELERELAEFQRTEPLKIQERNQLRAELAAAREQVRVLREAVGDMLANSMPLDCDEGFACRYRARAALEATKEPPMDDQHEHPHIATVWNERWGVCVYVPRWWAGRKVRVELIKATKEPSK